jgi:hypothetical protein
MKGKTMTADRFARVRIKATGEDGRIAELRGPTFYMLTHLPEYNTKAVWVFFEKTGEFRAYSQAALEYLPDN